MNWAGWLESPESIYSDLWHRLAGLRYKPAHVAIVILDEPTLAEHSEEPLVCWSPHFVRVIEVLRGAGARIMGLDYLYYLSIEGWLKTLNLPPNHPSLKYDAAFKAQLASGQVVMAANLGVDGQGKVKVILPIQSHLTSLPRRALDVRLVNFYTDADGGDPPLSARRGTPGLLAVGQDWSAPGRDQGVARESLVQKFPAP